MSDKNTFQNFNLSQEQILSYFKKQLAITEDESDTIIFCIFLILFLERTQEAVLKTTLEGAIKDELKESLDLQLILDELTFSSKIKISKKMSGKPLEHKPFLDFLKMINENIRNPLFHAKIEEINFKGKPINNLKIRQEILEELMTTLKKFITTTRIA